MNPSPDPEAAVAELAGCREPYLIGVRHHSPVLAAAVCPLLDAADPDAVLVELPHELEPWLPWLGAPGTEAPVALSVAGGAGERLGFYPFADFSPELAAIRWAVARGVSLHAIDLPVSSMSEDATSDEAGGPGRVSAALLRTVGVRDSEELWDRLLEARSCGAEPGRVRRAALALGWALRVDAAEHGIAHRDLVREAWMRRRIGEIKARRAAAVVGAFHAAALLPAPVLYTPPDVRLPDVTAPPAPGERGGPGDVVTALIPYAFDLLDSRSGYPAGIRDPEWQQAVFEAAGDPTAVERAAAERIATVCAELRSDGHVAGIPDSAAAYRLAAGLAALRGMPAPGRRELVEALQTALTQGERLGRSRAVARAAQRALVGHRRGRLAGGVPRSGLGPHVEALLAELRLPGPHDPADPGELRLDPFRSRMDLRRHVTMARLHATDVTYAEERPYAGVGDVPSLGRAWTAAWLPVTATTVELAGRFGMTLEQAAQGALRGRWAALEAADELTPDAQLHLVEQAAECGLPALTARFAGRLRHDLLPIAGLGELVAAYDLVERITGGHIPALPQARLDIGPAELAAAAIGAVPGIAGTENRADALALLHLIRIVERQEGGIGDSRLRWELGKLAAHAGPLAGGAAAAALVLLGHATTADLAARLVGWVDVPGGEATAPALAGVLTVAAPLLEGSADLLDPLARRVERWRDEEFLARLPALREGFDALSPAARQRFLDAVSDRLGSAGNWTLTQDPAQLAAWATSDLAGREAVRDLDPDGALDSPGDEAPRGSDPTPDGDSAAGAIAPIDRWRLVLGRERQRLSGPAARTARALDELYGHGVGEGSAGLAAAAGGGTDAPYPAAREWAEELEALFGTRIREEVLARAAARGRADALLELDPENVTPSIDLLEHVLSLAGSLPEAKLATLRRLANRLVAELTRQLAVRMRPALTGLATARPTRRPIGPLDLGRTIRANLHTARRIDDGQLTVVPERPVFRTRTRRSADWHVHIAVDVSGSMERSTIYSALVAAVLHGVPALSVRLVTFSTEVMDLSDRVADPLGLLLEVRVGGGTDIGAGLRYVRDRITVPARSIVALITDFEEGTSPGRLLGEVRALAESGAHLLGLAALDDAGQAVYSRATAEQVAAAGMPVAALSPAELAAWIGERVRGR